MVFRYLLMVKTPFFFWHPAKQSRPPLANAEEVVLTKEVLRHLQWRFAKQRSFPWEKTVISKAKMGTSMGS